VILATLGCLDLSKAVALVSVIRSHSFSLPPEKLLLGLRNIHRAHDDKLTREEADPYIYGGRWIDFLSEGNSMILLDGRQIYSVT
jgi:hypothetical protein